MTIVFDKILKLAAFCSLGAVCSASVPGSVRLAAAELPPPAGRAALDHSLSAEQQLGEQQKGEPELRVCTQNLFRLGLPPDRDDAQRPAEQKRDLVERMRQARCDIVALQEVGGRNQRQAKGTADGLAKALMMVTGKSFYAILGESRNNDIWNGFLISSSAGTVLSSRSFFRRGLPPLQPRGPAKTFSRGPLAILFESRPVNGSPAKKFVMVNLHFKSRRDGWKDPTGTDYEATRMEMAEAVREGAKEMVRGRDEQIPILIMGDRNSNEASATSAILAGTRVLDDFRVAGRCELGKKLEPVCPGIAPRKRQFVPLLQTEFVLAQDLNQKNRAGSFRYQRKSEFIDEILIDEQNLDLLRRADGSLGVGLTGEYYRGSDHKLLWAELNWGPN